MKTIDVIKVQGLMNQNKSGQVIALPGADRSEDALKYLQSTLVNDKPEGVILITVVGGLLEFRFFGKLIRSELAWAWRNTYSRSCGWSMKCNEY